jgi:hypothetical protein
MRVVTGPDGPPLRLAFGLDALALAALAAAVVLIETRDGSQGVVASVFAGIAFTVAIGAGAVCAWGLIREPLRTRAGRLAVVLAVAFTVSFPALGIITAALDLDSGWAEPVIPVQIAAALGAVVLGAVAHEPGRRGLLLVPVVIGASALMFVLTDLLFPY